MEGIAIQLHNPCNKSCKKKGIGVEIEVFDRLATFKLMTLINKERERESEE